MKYQMELWHGTKNTYSKNILPHSYLSNISCCVGRSDKKISRRKALKNKCKVQKTKTIAKLFSPNDATVANLTKKTFV